VEAANHRQEEQHVDGERDSEQRDACIPSRIIVWTNWILSARDMPAVCCRIACSACCPAIDDPYRAAFFPTMNRCDDQRAPAMTSSRVASRARAPESPSG
jgi:hypothetical protein